MSFGRIFIVSGSHSPESQSSRFAEYIKSRLNVLRISAPDTVCVHDLGSEPLPLWQNGSVYSRADEVVQADAVILISPEWHGMATPALKNWFLYMESGWLSHKPVLLCGVSGGNGGLYPVLELRSFSFKNFRPNYIPEHLVVKNVESVVCLREVSDDVSKVRRRIDYVLMTLRAYMVGFESVRKNLPDVSREFKYGL